MWGTPPDPRQSCSAPLDSLFFSSLLDSLKGSRAVPANLSGWIAG